jgi:hypothetical protein
VYSPEFIAHLYEQHGWSHTWVSGALRCEKQGDVGLIERNHDQAHAAVVPRRRHTHEGASDA